MLLESSLSIQLKFGDRSEIIKVLVFKLKVAIILVVVR